MEKILQQLLEGQSQIIKRLDHIEADISTLKADVSTLKADVSTLKADVSTLKTDVSTLKTDVSNVKGQLDENTQIIKALIHRADELDAKYDSLLHLTATKDSIASLDSKFDLLNNRLLLRHCQLQKNDYKIKLYN